MRSLAILLVATALLAACATRPPSKRGWTMTADASGPTLAYGLRAGAGPDFAIICDLPSKTADLVYHVGPVAGFAPNARTELLVGVGDAIDPLPAEVRRGEGEGLLIVARTLLPPAPVAEWAGKRVTVAAVGQATTLVVPPTRRQVDSFLAACSA